MDLRRFQEPSFVVAALNCVLLIALLVSRAGTPSHALPPTAPSRVVEISQLKEFDKALSVTESHLGKGDFEPAFDMVMVASRLAPSDPRLFDLVIHFIEKAMLSENEEVAAMAEDLLERGDSLVHFQAPSNVEASRKRLTELRQSFLKSAAPTPPPTPLDSVRRLLTVAENSTLPLSVRSRAVEQARSRIDDFQLDTALNRTEQMGQSKADALTEVLDKIDNAETQCITELFLQSKSKIDKWLSATRSLTKEIDAASADKVPDISKEIADLLSQGLDCLQELMPYSKSEVEGASALSSAVEKQVKLLQRQKNWLYNQQVLRRIREIESKKDWTPDDKIRHLAEVSEEVLTPYVLRRHNELWDKLFESLPNEEKKVWAVRLRILRLNE